MKHNTRSINPAVGESHVSSTLLRPLVSAFASANIADGMTLAALPILAARLTNSPAEISMVAAMRLLPWLVLAVPVSSLVDRLPKSYLLLVANLLRIVAAVSVILCLLTDSLKIEGLLVIGLLYGIAEVVYDSTVPALVPEYFQKAELQKTNTYLELIDAIGGKLVGTMLGSLLMSQAAFATFAVAALGHLASAVFLKRNFAAKSRLAALSIFDRRLLREMKEGLVYVVRSRVLVVQAMIGSLWNFSFAAVEALLVVFVLKTLALPEWTFGALLGVSALGAIAGSIATSEIVKVFKPRGAFILSVALFAAALIVCPLGSHIFVLAGGTFAAAFAMAVARIVMTTSRQHQIDPQILGRSLGFFRFVTWGVLPLGAIVGGALGEAFGPGLAISAVGVMATVGIPLACFGLSKNHFYN